MLSSILNVMEIGCLRELTDAIRGVRIWPREFPPVMGRSPAARQRVRTSGGSPKEGEMKRLLLLILVVGILLLGACGVEQVAIPQSAIDEIYTITQDETVNKYIEVIDTEDKPGYFVVTIEIKYVSEVMSTLEDAYSQAEIYTPTVARSTVEILNKYGIDKDVSVWGRLIFSEDEIVLLGNTWYDASSNSYRFERYKP